MVVQLDTSQGVFDSYKVRSHDAEAAVEEGWDAISKEMR